MTKRTGDSLIFIDESGLEGRKAGSDDTVVIPWLILAEIGRATFRIVIGDVIAVVEIESGIGESKDRERENS